MAFKLKTGKTINKVLAGAGIVSLLSLAMGMIAPQFLGSTTGKILEGLQVLLELVGLSLWLVLLLQCLLALEYQGPLL